MNGEKWPHSRGNGLVNNPYMDPMGLWLFLLGANSGSILSFAHSGLGIIVLDLPRTQQQLGNLNLNLYLPLLLAGG